MSATRPANHLGSVQLLRAIAAAGVLFPHAQIEMVRKNLRSKRRRCSHPVVLVPSRLSHATLGMEGIVSSYLFFEQSGSVTGHFAIRAWKWCGPNAQHQPARRSDYTFYLSHPFIQVIAKIIWFRIDPSFQNPWGYMVR
ncbi:hypothetical protein, partial [Hoeflea sp.]|uniref:hypothetical protein n=1 Tax=Hoeflea sp. TaxID=1940281 RepID=UPI0019BA2D04